MSAITRAGRFHARHNSILPQPPASALKMTVVCSWCQAVKVQGEAGGDVSHTICPECAAVHFPKAAAAVAIKLQPSIVIP